MLKRKKTTRGDGVEGALKFSAGSQSDLMLDQSSQINAAAQRKPRAR